MKLLLLLALFNIACNGTVTQNKDPKASTTEHPSFGDTLQALGPNIMVIHQDLKNNYWFGSWENGLYLFNGKKIIHYSEKHGLPSNRVEEIKEDAQGNLYFNTKEGIVKFVDNQFIKLKESYAVNEEWQLTPNDLWFKNFTNSNFVYRFDGSLLHKLPLPRIKLGEDWIKQNANSPSPYAVYTSYKDSRGNIWFGTAALGAMRFDGTHFDWITESDVNELHYGPSNGVRSIIEDKDGLFWFNTSFKYAVYKPLPNAAQSSGNGPFYERLKSIGFLDGNAKGNLNEYISITKDHKNRLWIAVYLNGVWLLDGDSIKHYPIQVDHKNIPIFCLYTDRQGNIWLGTQSNGAFRFNGKDFEKFPPEQ